MFVLSGDFLILIGSSSCAFSFHLNFSDSEFKRKLYTVVLKGCFYVGASLCGLIFLVRGLFSMDACHVFLQCVLDVIGGVIGVVVTRAFTGCSAGPPLCSVVVTVLFGAGLLPSCWRRSPRSISELWCEVGRTGALPLRKEPLSLLPPELSTGKCTLWRCLSPVVRAHKVHCCWHCPWPRVSHGNAGYLPGVPQAPCSQSH